MPSLQRTLMPLVIALAVVLIAAAAAARAAGTGGTDAPSGDAAASAPLAATSDLLLGGDVRFRGRLGTTAAARTVTIERRDRLTGEWVPVTTGSADGAGAYEAHWRADHIGRFTFRATIDRGGRASSASAAPEVALTVYRPSTATWFGPGFFGRRTACGEVLSHRLLGVAHKRLPCGTRIALLFAGRTIVVPVVDRGPFRRGTDWDLTWATARRLDMRDTSTIGAVRLRG